MLTIILIFVLGVIAYFGVKVYIKYKKVKNGIKMLFIDRLIHAIFGKGK